MLKKIPNFERVYTSLILIALLAMPFVAIALRAGDVFQQYAVSRFSTVFVGLVLQSLPFLLLGALLAAITETFLSAERVAAMFPKKSFKAPLFAVAAALIFPACDCAVLPLARRLHQKGVPLNAVVIFMLTSPIINPLVILASFQAFPTRPAFALLRMASALIIAFAAGAVITLLNGKASILNKEKRAAAGDACGCGHEHSHEKGFWGIVGSAKSEFMGVFPYFIMGAAICSVIQTVFDKAFFVNSSYTLVASNLLMMGLTFLFSVCSTADAFLAAGFVSYVPAASVLAFMTFGAMLDLKNMFVLFSIFKKRFVMIFAGVITGVAFLFFTLAGGLLNGVANGI
jgi:uncharacterized membrane protein YraQ (UPF0718 family)